MSKESPQRYKAELVGGSFDGDVLLIHGFPEKHLDIPDNEPVPVFADPQDIPKLIPFTIHTYRLGKVGSGKAIYQYLGPNG